jgi:hypothetical protein
MPHAPCEVLAGILVLFDDAFHNVDGAVISAP